VQSYGKAPSTPRQLAQRPAKQGPPGPMVSLSPCVLDPCSVGKRIFGSTLAGQVYAGKGAAEGGDSLHRKPVHPFPGDGPVRIVIDSAEHSARQGEHVHELQHVVRVVDT
jgi:hypothetical protein